MKNNKTVTSYLSTTQAAQRLGLSVGTIQRMVQAGVLQAYTTLGGHRRILASSLRVEALMSDTPIEQHNQISFRITGQLWAQPVPLEMLIRTTLDLETGQVELFELSK